MSSTKRSYVDPLEIGTSPETHFHTPFTTLIPLPSTMTGTSEDGACPPFTTTPTVAENPMTLKQVPPASPSSFLSESKNASSTPYLLRGNKHAKLCRLCQWDPSVLQCLMFHMNSKGDLYNVSSSCIHLSGHATAELWGRRARVVTPAMLCDIIRPPTAKYARSENGKRQRTMVPFSENHPLSDGEFLNIAENINQVHVDETFCKLQHLRSLNFLQARISAAYGREYLLPKLAKISNVYFPPRASLEAKRALGVLLSPSVKQVSFDSPAGFIVSPFADNDPFFDLLATSAPNLQELYLNRDSYLYPITYNMFERHQNLKKVELCGDIGVLSMMSVTKARSVTELHLRDVRMRVDPTFEDDMRSGESWLKHGECNLPPLLRQLVVRLQMGEHYHPEADGAVISFLQKMVANPFLESVEFSDGTERWHWIIDALNRVAQGASDVVSSIRISSLYMGSDVLLETLGSFGHLKRVELELSCEVVDWLGKKLGSEDLADWLDKATELNHFKMTLKGKPVRKLSMPTMTGALFSFASHGTALFSLELPIDASDFTKHYERLERIYPPATTDRFFRRLKTLNLVIENVDPDEMDEIADFLKRLVPLKAKVGIEATTRPVKKGDLMDVSSELACLMKRNDED